MWHTALAKANFDRDSKWTQSIAVGSEPFVTAVKNQMHALDIGRRIRSSKDCYELRETLIPYKSHFEVKKFDIDPKTPSV